MFGFWSWIRLFMVVICVSLPVQTDAKDVIDTLVVNRIYHYRESVDSSLEGMTTHAYVKYKLKTDRRNVLLYCVPHLHTMAKTKNRNPFFESFVQLTFFPKAPLFPPKEKGGS